MSPRPPASAPLPDAGANWVDRRAPEAWKPWLKLGRFDRPVGIWLLLLPGWQGIALALAMGRFWQTPGWYDLWLFAGFALGACLMRAAGCAFNDIVDRDIDAKVARTAARPVASGQISVKQAWAFVVGCSLVSLLILLTFNLLTVLLGIASLALVAAYPFMKRITWWPQAWLGLTFNWGALMGFAAALPAVIMGQKPAGIFAPVWGLWSGVEPGWIDGEGLVYGYDVYLVGVFLYLGGVFWTLGYDTIYALQDIDDDALIGVKSSARRLGPGTRRGVATFYAVAVLFTLPALGLATEWRSWSWVAVLPYALHLFDQVRRLRLDDPALALRLFKSNRDAGFILLAAIALGAIPL